MQLAPSFSFFKAPVTNKTPHKSITLLDAWNYVAGHYAQAETEKLRSIEDKDAERKVQGGHFAYCTFSGVFSERANDKLVEHSGYLCLDFDHVKDIDALKRMLLDDPYFETELMFRSPSGDGLKWIVKINVALMPHPDYFRSVSYLDSDLRHRAINQARTCPERFCPSTRKRISIPKSVSDGKTPI